ncbi:MAG: tol-pal system protein YbgF [Deltaproteobacteria bacterium]|nr:tol-pal system protein YbgF [Deltaproteobacteria bacterium]
MARLRNWLLPAIACLLLSSCVYDQEMSYFNNQIVSLNRRVSSLEESAGGDLGSKLDTLQSSQARLQLEIDQIKTEVSELSGRTEDNEHLARRIVEQDLSDLDAMKARLEELTEKLDRMDRMVRRQQQYLGLEPPEEPAPAETSAPQARPAPPPAGGPSAPEEAMPSGEIELYEYALGLYREGDYKEAQKTFDSFLDQYPKSDRADNAHFWIGEAHMALEQYEQAILAFQKVIKDYPKGNKVANAMLRQAVAFLEIKDKTSARLLLKKIVKEYPGTNEAELAKKKLEAL